MPLPGNNVNNGTMLSATPSMPGGSNVVPEVQSVPAPDEIDVAGLIKTIAIVILSLVAATFIGLFIWMSINYSEARADVDGQIAVAVNAAVDENTMELEAEFLEREKEPYRDFAGPADYGELSFKYPKTWSVYVAKDASRGGDFEAYFNPIEVNEVSNNTINALRLKIVDEPFDNVAQTYQRFVEREENKLSVQSVTVAGVAANRYTGTIPNTELSGIIVIFKIRDKTAVFQTDSMNFENDFEKLLKTIQFNA